MVSGFKVEMSEVNLLLLPCCDSTVGSCDSKNNFNPPLKLTYLGMFIQLQVLFYRSLQNTFFLVHCLCIVLDLLLGDVNLLI
jgi:hypothetical protein